MSSFPLIGLTGLSKAGKSTVAKILVRNHGFTEMTFAAPMLDGLRALDPIIGWVAGEPVRFAATLDELGWDLTKHTYGEARRLAQRFGTEVGRQQFGENVWVGKCEARILAAGDRPIVISDVRFQNEADMLRSHWGFILRVERPGLAQRTWDHESEQHVYDIKPDAVLINSGGLKALEKQVAELVTKFDTGAWA